LPIPPDMARGLFRHFIGAIRGAAQYRKASFLLNAAGQEVFPSFLADAGATAHSQRIGERAVRWRRRRDNMIATWCAMAFYKVTYWAATRSQVGSENNGNAGGVHNLIVAAPGKALDMPSFLARMKTGLLVTEMMGQGVNGVTGRLFAGASGFWWKTVSSRTRCMRSPSPAT